MNMENIQTTLSQNQIEAFYHDAFVESQVGDFIKLIDASVEPKSGKVVDIGGGCGFFAKALENRTAFKVRVLDTDMQSIAVCKQSGLDAASDDALNPTVLGDEQVICFNLILHHLVGKTEAETSKLQRRALSVWHKKANAIFVNEYIYESFIINNFSGWLIYQITSSSLLSSVGSFIAKLFPSLKANTFGVGVRFRSHAEWENIFQSLGFEVVKVVTGVQENVSFPRRLLLIKNCRRDSFLLKPIIKQA